MSLLETQTYCAVNKAVSQHARSETQTFRARPTCELHYLQHWTSPCYQVAVFDAYELVLDWGQVGWPLRRQAQEQSSKRLPLILESCGGSVLGNYKLVTDLV